MHLQRPHLDGRAPLYPWLTQRRFPSLLTAVDCDMHHPVYTIRTIRTSTPLTLIHSPSQSSSSTRRIIITNSASFSPYIITFTAHIFPQVLFLSWYIWPTIIARLIIFFSLEPSHSKIRDFFWYFNLTPCTNEEPLCHALSSSDDRRQGDRPRS